MNAITVLEHNLWSLWSNFGLGSGCALHDEPDLLWFETPIAALPYNTVLRFTAAHDTDRRLDAVVDHFRRRGVPQLWVVHPSAAPADLGARLERRGLLEIEVVAGMVADIGQLPEPAPLSEGCEVREVTDDRDAQQVFELIAWRWNIPAECRPHLGAFEEVFQVGRPSARVRCWLAWRNGLPVAKCVLHLAAGAAGLYGVVTRPEARGLGLARRLAIDSLRAARDAGSALAVLHATPMAESLYAKLGFRSVAPFRLYSDTAAHI